MQALVGAEFRRQKLRRARILGAVPPYFFESQLAQIPQQGENVSSAVFNAFLSTRDGVALMRAFVKNKRKSLQHKLARLVNGLAG